MALTDLPDWKKTLRSVGKHAVVMAALSAVLFTASVFYILVNTAVLGIVALITAFRYRKISVFLLLGYAIGISLLPLIPLAAVQYPVLSQPFFKLVSLWEMGITRIDPNTLLMTTGLIAFLIPIGLIPYIKNLSPLRLIGIVYVALSVLLYYSPLPNAVGIPYFRILHPPLYVFMGIMAIEGLSLIAGLLVRNKNPQKQQLLLSVGILIFLCIQIPTLSREIKKRIGEYYLNSQLNYVDKNIYDGLLFMRSQPRDKAAVAINTLENLIPVISGHTVYSGHVSLTVDYDRKINELIQFFYLKYDADTAYRFLKSNGIGFVLWRTVDGDPNRFSVYPFLLQIYGNPGLVIYAVQ